MLTVSGLTLFAIGVQQVSASAVATVLLMAAVANAARLIGWGALASRHRPVLWVLHLSYAWIPAGLVLLALNAMSIVSTSAAIHALAVGAVAGMMLGMMTRTSRGHTGLPMHAGRSEVVAYACIHLAALARVAAGLAGHALYGPLLALAAACWVLAFALFALRFTGVLTSPRADGRPG